MKRIQFATIALSVLLPACFTEAAPRKVMFENFTATWCTYCPDMANGLIMLMDEYPDTCFSMQIHGQDAYDTPWGDVRNLFYSVPGYPGVWIDGVLNISGSYGSPSANYNQLRSRYLQRIATPTDVTIEMCGSPVDSDTYSVTAVVGIENGGSSKTMKIHCAQILHNYPSSPSYNYGCFKQANLQTISITAGTSQDISFNFDLDSSSAGNLQNVSYIVWAQATNSSGPSEVYQAAKHVHNGGDCQIDNFIVGPKGQYTTISEALELAGTGDTITVLPGTYIENIDLHGVNIVIESTDGPEVTIIDGNDVAPVVRMYEQESSTIRGFTLQNGNSVIGAGVLCNGAPIIENCILRDNVSQLGAGIFHFENGTTGPTVSDSLFCSNKGTDIHGVWIDGGGNVFEDSCEANACPADITGDSFVNVGDLLAVIDAWGSSGGIADINADGMVDVGDLLEVVGSWGACDGSGL